MSLWGHFNNRKGEDLQRIAQLLHIITFFQKFQTNKRV